MATKMEEILNIQTPVKYDNSLAHYEIHAHQPYVSSAFNNSDQIRIAVQHQDLYILPSKSTLHVQGRLTKTDNTDVTNTKLFSNGICYLFSDIRYELNGVEIDRCKNVGLTTTMKSLISQTPNQMIYAENAGYIDSDDASRVTNDHGYFDVNVPLNMILGYAEDYRKIVVNANNKLILTRSRTDLNAIVNIQGLEREEFKIVINKVEWMIPYLFVGDRQKIELLKFTEKDSPITMSFRSWDLYEYPMIPATQKHVWTVKTSTQIEKPRYVILGLQTNRKENRQNIPFKSMHHWLLSIVQKQNEFLKQASVDVRLEFEASDNFPANTAAYCLIIHDRIIQYTPISGIVKKVS
ncbi:uncharacterized protein LOC127287548 [Leptopilina boulardi]|uniref:uncharacterized protein LOC127287548 n=1 Tax=Leptopilina boulardi TaxID=63433 RepID=UPI0021F5187B|nr:uncharacterized protein LOC127287548 [Leptopilina boulardi]